MKKSGIYLIKNKINSKVYIGASGNLEQRKQNNFTKLRAGKHHSLLLQAAFNEFKEENFSFVILEETIDLENREQYWCDYYKSNNPNFGYNIRKEVNSNKGNVIIISDTTKANISKALKGKTPSNLSIIREKQKRPVKLHINDVYHNTYESQEDASSKTGISKNNINNQVRGISKVIRGYESYVFSYADGEGVRKINFNLNSITSKPKKITATNIITGDKLNFDNCTLAAEHFKVGTEAIKSVCRGQTQFLRQHKNYKLEYE